MRHDGEGKKVARIKISNLTNGEHQFDFQCLREDFADETIDGERFKQPILIRINLTKAASEIIANLSVSTVADLQCDRCLAPISKSVSGSYRLMYVQSTGAQEATDDGDVRFISKNETHIDLTEDARETLILAMPIKTICDSNCAATDLRIEREFKSENHAPSAWQAKLAELGKKFKN
jgi:uncharacterized protein